MKPYLFCYSFVLLIHSAAVYADDVNTLETLVKIIRSNDESIRNWKGKVTIDSHYSKMGMKAEKQHISEEKSKRTIVFCSDLITGNKISFAVYEECSQLLNGKWIIPLFCDKGALSIPSKNEYYTYRYYPKNRYGMSLKGEDGKQAMQAMFGYEITNPVLLTIQESSDWQISASSFFDPVFYMNKIDGHPAIMMLDNLCKRLKNNNIRNFSQETEPEWRLLKDGSFLSVILDVKIDDGNSKLSIYKKWTNDVSKGGMLVRFEVKITKESEIDESLYECEPQYVNEVWIPKVINIKSPDETHKITFVEANINGKLDSSEFTLAQIGVHQGDRLEDLRTQTTIILHGSDLLSPDRFDPSNLHRAGNYYFVQYIFILLGSILILTAFFRMYRKYRAKHQEVK